MGALRVQTAFNIREWAGRRKQKPVRGPESRSKRVRCLFGIQGRLEWFRALEGRYRIALRSFRDSSNRLLGGGPAFPYHCSSFARSRQRVAGEEA